MGLPPPAGVVDGVGIHAICHLLANTQPATISVYVVMTCWQTKHDR